MRLIVRFLLAMFVVSVSTGAVADPPNGYSGPLRMLAVGDSITENNTTEPGRRSWVFPFQENLSVCSTDWEMVGRDSSPYATYRGETGLSAKRFAVGGFNTSGVLAWANDLEDNPENPFVSVPDIVIYYLGLNNTLGGGWTSDSKGYNPPMGSNFADLWESDTQAFINLVRTYNSNVSVVIIKLQNTDPDTATINSRIDGFAAANSTANSTIYVAPAPVFVSGDLFDNHHPSPAGAQKLANIASDAVIPILQANGKCGGAEPEPEPELEKKIVLSGEYKIRDNDTVSARTRDSFILYSAFPFAYGVDLDSVRVAAALNVAVNPEYNGTTNDKQYVITEEDLTEGSIDALLPDTDYWLVGHIDNGDGTHNLVVRTIQITLE